MSQLKLYLVGNDGDGNILLSFSPHEEPVIVDKRIFFALLYKVYFHESHEVSSFKSVDEKEFTASVVDGGLVIGRDEKEYRFGLHQIKKLLKEMQEEIVFDDFEIIEEEAQFTSSTWPELEIRLNKQELVAFNAGLCTSNQTTLSIEGDSHLYMNIEQGCSFSWLKDRLIIGGSMKVKEKVVSMATDMLDQNKDQVFQDLDGVIDIDPVVGNAVSELKEHLTA